LLIPPPLPALAQSALIDVVRTDTGEARVEACCAMSNISGTEENWRDMYQNEILMVSSGVEGSSTIAQDS
jgi:hypothetical protein